MKVPFAAFFQGEPIDALLNVIQIALAEDGPDLTSNAVFSHGNIMHAEIVAKEACMLAGLPIARMVLQEVAEFVSGTWEISEHVEEGTLLQKGTKIISLMGDARILLRSERVILNFICHLSGIATLTSKYVKALEGTGITLLDTRKTLPGLRYPEKYAVLVGGGKNHRRDLAEILMLKDNHIDAAGGIIPAVECLRKAYGLTSPIEVECRTLKEVREAVSCMPNRIMLDNMDATDMAKALDQIPREIEVEISGGISLDSLGVIDSLTSKRKPDFVSVGRIIHSAPYADLSMKIL